MSSLSTGKTLHFRASHKRPAQLALRALQQRYGDAGEADAEVIVALGGDGFMLETMHRYMGQARPVFGMNCGTLGFLLNTHHEDDLPERVAAAEPIEIRPLSAKGKDTRGRPFHMLAINEVSLLRQTRQTAKLAITIDGRERLSELVADGVLVATPAGSTAYNFSAHGPILPISARLLALTPISAFRPRRWRGALLPSETRVGISVHDPEARPVSATGDNHEVRDVVELVVEEDPTLSVSLLFDTDHDLHERILLEQFAH